MQQPESVPVQGGKVLDRASENVSERATAKIGSCVGRQSAGES